MNEYNDAVATQAVTLENGCKVLDELQDGSTELVNVLDSLDVMCDFKYEEVKGLIAEAQCTFGAERAVLAERMTKANTELAMLIGLRRKADVFGKEILAAMETVQK